MSNRFFGIVAVLAVAAGLFAIFGAKPQGAEPRSLGERLRRKGAAASSHRAAKPRPLVVFANNFR